MLVDVVGEGWDMVDVGFGDYGCYGCGDVVGIEFVVYMFVL